MSKQIVRFLILVWIVAGSRMAFGQQPSPPVEPSSVQEIDRLLQRVQELIQPPQPSGVTACSARPGARDPLVVLDGAGRFLDFAATKERPAYLAYPGLRLKNQPSSNDDSRLADGSDPNVLTLETEKDLNPKDPNAGTLSRTITPGSEVCVPRTDLQPYEEGGFVKLLMKRQKQTISTLWFILRAPNVIVLNENGPIDPSFNSVSPVYVPGDTVSFEYLASDPAAAPQLVLESAVRDIRRSPLKRWGALTARPSPPAPPGPAGLVIPWAELDQYKRDGDRHVELLLIKNGRAINAFALTRQQAKQFAPPEFYLETPSAGVPRRVYEITLDRLGVASPEYLNRRRPAFLAVNGAETFVRLRNLLTDRVFIVTFQGIPETDRAELVRDGIQIGNCRDGKCQASVRLGPSGSTLIPVAPLRNAYAKAGLRGTVTVQVSFFDDDTTPTNSRAYVTFVNADQFTEPGSSTTWSAAISATLARDPDLTSTFAKGTKQPTISFEKPISRLNRTHASGGATIGLKQGLGSRADAEFELSAKKGDFGEDVGTIQTSKYLTNVYPLYGATFTAGRFDIAAPTNAIAMSEAGEAVNLSLKIPGVPWGMYANAGYIFKKELADGSFTTDAVAKAIEQGASSLDRHNRATVIQIRDILPGRSALRASIYGVIGHADRGRTFKVNPADTMESPTLVEFDADYWTSGVDAIWNIRRASLTGGLFFSKRSGDAPQEVSRGSDNVEGKVGLLTFSYSNPDAGAVVQGRQGVDFAISGSVGAGGAYVGESQSFTPDSLFLNTFAGALREPTLTIGPGLTNKWYYGLVATTPKKTWLEWVAKKLHFPVDDINTVGTSLKLHHYRLRQPGGETRALGTEGNFEVRVESPKGVRYQLTMAAFHPGEVLKPETADQVLLTKIQYAVRFNVTVRFE